MESNIIILIDYEQQKIRLFGESYNEIMFEDVFLLKYILDGKTALYITSANEVDFSDLTNLISSITMSHSNEQRYLHSTVEGYLKAEDVNLIFAGPKDIKPLNKLSTDIFERSAKLREYLRQGKIKVITETEAMKFKANRILSKDASLDRIILNKPVDQVFSGQENIFDSEEIDEITDSTEIETEAEMMIKRGFGKR